MPATAYTDETLKEYMHQQLRATAAVLDWSVAIGSYDQPLNEALRAAGLTSAGAAKNVGLLEAYAKRELWQAVMNETAADYNYTAANGTERREAIFEHARLMLAQSERFLVLVYGVGGMQRGGATAISNEAAW